MEPASRCFYSFPSDRFEVFKYDSVQGVPRNYLLNYLFVEKKYYSGHSGNL